MLAFIGYFEYNERVKNVLFAPYEQNAYHQARKFILRVFNLEKTAWITAIVIGIL
jgi:hypothetical protein